MTDIHDYLEKIEEGKTAIEKAEYLDEDTSEQKKRLQELYDGLMNQLIEKLDEQIPKDLPMLEIDKTPTVDLPDLDEIIELFTIDVEDEDGYQLDLQVSKERKVLKLIAKYYFYKEDYEKATGYFRYIVDHKQNMQQQDNLVISLANQKLYSSALEILKTKEDLTWADYNNLGVIYDRLGRYSKATEAYQSAIDGNEDSVLPRINLALTHRNFTHRDKAIEILHELIKEDLVDKKRSAEILSLLGDIHARNGDFQLAQKYFEKAFNLADENPKIIDSLAHVYMITKQNQKAKKLYTKLLDYQKTAGVYNNLGAIEVRNDKYEEALEYFEKALEIDPEHKESKQNYDRIAEYIDQ